MPPNNLQTAPFDLLSSPLDGRNLIEASAGTGKTFTITRIFMRLLLEKRLPLHSLLTVTFTEAATAELRERIYVLIKEAITAFKTQHSEDPLLSELIKKIKPEDALPILSGAVTNFDTCSVYTIHGFCQRLLTDYSFESGSTFDATLIKDINEYITEASEDFWRINFYDAPETLIRYLITQKITPDTFASVFKAYSNHSSAKFVPKCNPVDFEASQSAFAALHSELASQWKDCRQEVEKLLRSGALKATRYKDSTITEMVESMERFCDSQPDAGLFRNFSHFNASVLKEYTKKGSQTPTHGFFDICDTLSEKASELSDLYTAHIDHLYKVSVKFISDRITLKKEQQNVLFFDDLLKRVLATIKSHHRGSSFISAVKRKYRAALIDEFQDTDPTQYEIFDRLFGNNETITFFIGDPKQAIYSFRGADIFTYLTAVQKVTSRYTLATNYRSDPALVNAVTALFKQSARPFLLEEIGISDVSGGVKNPQHITINGVKQKPLTLWFMDSDSESASSKKQLPDVVANQIAMLTGRCGVQAIIGQIPISPSHCAILVRTNMEAFEYQNALAAISIPSVVDSSSSVFSTQEALELYYLLCAIADPSEELISTALTLPFFNYSSSDLVRFSADENFYSSIWLLFMEAHTTWLEKGFGSMIHNFFKTITLEEKILSLTGGERKITNYLHLTELLQNESQSAHHRTSAITSYFAQKIRHSEDQVPDDNVIRLESDDSAVKILTVHKSKGLEFDIVFCPTLAITKSDRKKDQLPYIVHDTRENLSAPLFILGDKEREAFKPRLDHETLAESLRLFYVALTRAKSQCFMIYDKSDASATSPLSWLLFGNDIHYPETEALRDTLKPLSSGDIWNSLKAKCNSMTHLSLEPLPSIITLEKNSQKTAAPILGCSILEKELPQPWKISSYSSLATNAAHAQSFSDIRSDEPFIETAPQNAKLPERTIFTFPKGAAAGTFLHSVIESVNLPEMDQAANSMAVIEENLLQAGIDSEWSNVVAKLLADLAGADFRTPEKSISLAALDNEKCVREMEFCFPLRDITSSQVISAFSEEINLFGDNYTGEGLHFGKTGGFLKGFIDMVFLHDDKYYIIDWKSNFLGDKHSDYAHEHLLPVMLTEHYVLQYHLYCVALDQYLRVHLAGYNYDQHFGGVFYCFLRGVKPGTDNGILFRRPEKEFLERLSGVFVGG